MRRTENAAGLAASGGVKATLKSIKDTTRRSIQKLRVSLGKTKQKIYVNTTLQPSFFTFREC